MSNYVNPLSLVAAAPMAHQKGANGGKGSLFEALAQAWAQALDKQAETIIAKSDAINNGDDSPGAVTALTTESLKMSYLSNSSHTSISTVGQALETMARKQ
jgi:hypothetical protein